MCIDAIQTRTQKDLQKDIKNEYKFLRSWTNVSTVSANTVRCEDLTKPLNSEPTSYVITASIKTMMMNDVIITCGLLGEWEGIPWGASWTASDWIISSQVRNTVKFVKLKRRDRDKIDTACCHIRNKSVYPNFLTNVINAKICLSSVESLQPIIITFCIKLTRAKPRAD